MQTLSDGILESTTDAPLPSPFTAPPFSHLEREREREREKISRFKISILSNS
jgi:hypothetical protein